MQIGELDLVSFDFLFIFGDPFLVLPSQLQLVFFELLDLFLPLVVAFRLKQLDLRLELLYHVVFLL